MKLYVMSIITDSQSNMTGARALRSMLTVTFSSDITTQRVSLYRLAPDKKQN